MFEQVQAFTVPPTVLQRQPFPLLPWSHGVPQVGRF